LKAPLALSAAAGDVGAAGVYDLQPHAVVVPGVGGDYRLIRPYFSGLFHLLKAAGATACRALALRVSFLWVAANVRR
jgi:hypothetical protein